jgi:hypothetical protein
MSFVFFLNFIFTKLLFMQTIRGSFLIVSFFFISICSLTQKQTDINQALFIADEITFDSYLLKSFSERDNSTDLAPDNSSNVNTSLKVKAIQPILMITELHADDLLFNPYVL